MYTILSKRTTYPEAKMRSLGDVLGRSEEMQNLKSGGILIATLCAVIVVLFLALNLNVGIEPGVSQDGSISQTADLDD